MKLKKLPYLDHEDKYWRYDAIEVGEIMADIPVQSVAPVETVGRIVKLLRESRHNGYPVIDPNSKKFLGLVRRDQLAALIECGVFEAEPLWTRPQAGSSKTPLMSKCQCLENHLPCTIRVL